MVGSRTRRGGRSSGTGHGRVRTSIALCVVSAALLTGCGSNAGRPDLSVPLGQPNDGAALFEEGEVAPSCGTCHTLSAAGWEGSFAPDLGSMQPGYERILTAVTNGPGAMPSYAGRLTDQQLRDLAAHVAELILESSADG